MNPTGDSKEGNGTPPAPLGAGTGGQEEAPDSATSLLLSDPAKTQEFDHVIFDTAPTGHTLRLLEFPAAWTGFLEGAPGDVSCLGPLSGLKTQRETLRGHGWRACRAKTCSDHAGGPSGAKRAEGLRISRGSVHYLRGGPERRPCHHAASRPAASGASLAGSRMLRGLMVAEGCKIGRRHVKTLMQRMGMEAPYTVRVRPNPSPATRSIRICCAGWQSRGRTKFGRWTSPTFRWRAVLSIWPWCSTGSAAGCCHGDCRSPWKQHSAFETLEDAFGRYAKPDVFNTDQGSQFTGQAFTGALANNGITISMDGKGAWRDNVFVEWLWRSIKYEEVYLRAYVSVDAQLVSKGQVGLLWFPEHDGVAHAKYRRSCFSGDQQLQYLVDSRPLH